MCVTVTDKGALGLCIKKLYQPYFAVKVDTGELELAIAVIQTTHSIQMSRM